MVDFWSGENVGSHLSDSYFGFGDLSFELNLRMVGYIKN
jgi:hypothetical protein